jgi:glycogen synthase
VEDNKYFNKEDIKIFKIKNFRKYVVRAALDRFPEATFENLKRKFGKLKSVKEFIESENYLGGVSVKVKGLKEQLKNVANKYNDKFKIRFEFNEPLSHIIEAGCDFFLMPSQYEPFGLNFAYSLLYGSIPIARKTGGLADLSDNIDFQSGKGNSIVFEKYEVKDFVDAIERALKLYHNKELMKIIINRNMNSDFSWSQSAKEYESIYKFILKEQNKENE